MTFCKIANHEDMIILKRPILEGLIRDYVIHLRHDRKLSPATVPFGSGHFACALLLTEVAGSTASAADTAIAIATISIVVVVKILFIVMYYV